MSDTVATGPDEDVNPSTIPKDEELVSAPNASGDDDSDQTADLTDEDLRTLGVLKEHASGYSPEELITLANEGLEATRRRREEEDRMFQEHESERKAAAPKGGADGDDDLISRADAARLVEERIQQVQAERTHEEMAAKHGLTADEAYFVRNSVEGALADPRNKGVTLETAYEYVMTAVLRKPEAPALPAKKGKDSDGAKKAIQQSARVSRARPAASGSASPQVPSAAGPPSWDDPSKPDWDLFSSEREERLLKELGIT